MTATTRTHTDRARWTALLVLCAGMLMIVLDATIVNVALPTIQADLHFTQSTLAWVVNGYLITFGGLLLLAGRLGDLLGRRRMFLIGLTMFTIASAVCGIASSQAMLVAARFVQGAGGAVTSAVILGMIVTMFPEPREQAKAIGVYAFVASAGGSIGLLVGGVLTQALNWHWIFFVNIPIGIATGLLARRLLPNDEGIGLGEGADIAGAALITAALMLGVYTIVKPAAQLGWGATPTLELGAISVALLAAFIAREATARSPLIPLRIFRSRNVSGANLVQALSVAGMFGTVLPRRAVPAPRAPLRRARDRACVRADDADHGGAVAPLHRAARDPIRRPGDGEARPRPDRRWNALVHSRSGARELRHGRAADDDRDRDRLRSLLPGADDAVDVRGDAERCGARIRAGQHDRAGRRGARAGRTRDSCDDEDPQFEQRRGANRRLPRRVPDRRAAGAGRAGGRIHRPGARAGRLREPLERRAGDRSRLGFARRWWQ